MNEFKSSPLTRQEFDLFRGYIESESGISLDDEKAYLLENRLKFLLNKYESHSFGDLFQKVKAGKHPLLKIEVIDAITTNETLWFRDSGPYKILQDVFLPKMVEEVAKGKPRIRIWSAACSTGQEPYSIAITINEFCNHSNQDILKPSHIEILATDISKNAIETSRLGAYDKLSVSRGMPDELLSRYFKQNQNLWIIDPNLKKNIEFREFNLKNDFSPLGTFDIIFCRNVAIYFSSDFKKNLFHKLRMALRPGGFFFLGSSETLSYYSNEFNLKEHNKYNYYTV